MKTSVDIFYRLKLIGLKLKIIAIVVILCSCAPKKSPELEYIPQGARKGVASWYGAEFHGKPTASGEIYNMYDYTCAHREYPFGTKLRVVNLQNGKDVVCTVNDRGPFIPGRDLDLSYASAKKIDLIGPGTAEVLMEPVGRDMSYVRYVKYTPIGGPLTIQVGAFREIENALRLKQALSFKYQNVYINKASVKGQIFYRVRVGKFSNYDDAFNLAKQMGQEGYKVIITGFVGGKDEI
ncbi:rare lipoprotein A [Thermodesulfovibrio aggregans]|uniref:Probable endolytic peptidoglycan transglycosylase RlpA n=1 Tax=Thermodesulfovibrio aggregans TaxID=86166 RepID=A0A0U9HV98_9BACT|nr:rare lipoprotein A [Thermodesulfovibrio aggregans]